MSQYLAVMNRNKQTIRGPVNPMDKSTIFSILPKDIVEKKVTLMPGVFNIPKGSPDNPTAYIVGPSSWFKELDEHQPLLEIPNHSLQMAESIVKDYCNGLICCDMGETMPGLFYLPGEWTAEKLKKEHSNLLKDAIRRQNNWYIALVRMADSDWAKTNGNPRSINDDMRLAAEQLGLKNKAWMVDFNAVDNIACVACGAMRNPLFPICQSCHTVVDKAKAIELGLVSAK